MSTHTITLTDAQLYDVLSALDASVDKAGKAAEALESRGMDGAAIRTLQTAILGTRSSIATQVHS